MGIVTASCADQRLFDALVSLDQFHFILMRSVAGSAVAAFRFSGWSDRFRRGLKFLSCWLYGERLRLSRLEGRSAVECDKLARLKTEIGEVNEWSGR